MIKRLQMVHFNKLLIYLNYLNYCFTINCMNYNIAKYFTFLFFGIPHVKY